MAGVELQLAGRTLRTERPALIMGIVNATPDSFFAGSRGGADDALRLIDEGADIIDIGGESTRPGSSYVDCDEEIRRIVPVIEEIRRHSAVPVSVDTRKKAVMEAAYNAGADILNDVSALEDDGDMASFAAATGIPVILMHKRGIPSDMQRNTSYADVCAEVCHFLFLLELFPLLLVHHGSNLLSVPSAKNGGSGLLQIPLQIITKGAFSSEAKWCADYSNTPLLNCAFVVFLGRSAKDCCAPLFIPTR